MLKKKERVGSQVPVLPSTAKQFPNCTSTERLWSRKSNAKQWIILLKLILLHEIEGSMEKLLYKCVDYTCIARAEGEGNASTDECNDFSILPSVYYNRSVCWQHP